VPKPLAEIVIEEGLASRETLDRAAEHSDQNRIPLVAALIREFDLDEVAVVAAIRRHVRVPMADPKTAVTEPEAIREIARDVCQRLRVVPLSVAIYDDGPKLMRLAMADPTDTVAVAEVEHVSGCTVEPELMTLSAIEEMVEISYRHFVTEVMKRDRKPFGEGIVKQVRGAESGKSADSPGTVPFHRISDEAELPLRLEALVTLLLEKGVIGEDEFEEQVRQLMKRRDGDG
jgi:hypothetical protein